MRFCYGVKLKKKSHILWLGACQCSRPNILPLVRLVLSPTRTLLIKHIKAT